MLSWSLTFFIFSLIAAIFGFTGIAATTSSVAQLLFFVFIILFVFSLLRQLANKGDKLIK